MGAYIECEHEKRVHTFFLDGSVSYMGLDEKSAVVLAQYDLSVKSYYRQKGAGYLETEQGLFLLRAREAREGRVVWEEEVKKCAVKRGFTLLDLGVLNREGKYITEGDYAETFLLRQCRAGEEVDLRIPEHREGAAKTLGRLHLALQGAPVKEEYLREPAAEVFEKRIRELRRLRTYLSQRKKKNAFERKLLELLPYYLERAEAALCVLLEGDWQEPYIEAKRLGKVCHGNYGSHALLYLEGGELFVGNFERAGIGAQAEDLCYLIRKSMEKTEWQPQLCKQLLAAYEKEGEISAQQRRLLFCMLLFPEKFYRVCNQYFNTGKAWIPAKLLQKLSFLLEQKEAKERFDKTLETFLD